MEQVGSRFFSIIHYSLTQFLSSDYVQEPRHRLEEKPDQDLTIIEATF